MPSTASSAPLEGAPRTRLGRLWAPVFMMIGISILSGSAGIQMGPLSFVGVDKVGHFAVFGLLGIAWVRVFSPARVPMRSHLFTAVALTTLFGLADELHQYRNPMRYFEWADLGADFAGAVVATGLYRFCEWFRALLEVKIGRVLRLPSVVKIPNVPADGRG
ncbi:MAG: VanZ family protein [Opitutales bacterium]